MNGEAVSASFQQQACTSFCIAAGQPQVGFAHDSAHGIKQRLARDAVVDHVDRTAHSAAAIHQRTGAAQHFNALHADRVAGHGVVIAQA